MDGEGLTLVFAVLNMQNSLPGLEEIRNMGLIQRVSTYIQAFSATSQYHHRHLTCTHSFLFDSGSYTHI